jgi:hypothetical protein
MFFTIFILLLFTSPAYAVLAIDSSGAMNETHFRCLGTQGFNFFLGHLLHSYTGLPDMTGILNLIYATNAGWGVQGYITPCVGYAIGCRAASDQMNNVVDVLNQNGFDYKNFVIWIDVENSDPKNLWHTDPAINQQFLTELVSTATQRDHIVGIYTNAKSWSQIMGPTYAGFYNYLLWNINWNGAKDTSTGFVPFGGWTINSVSIHQYAGAVTTNACYQCSTCQLNYDFAIA